MPRPIHPNWQPMVEASARARRARTAARLAAGLKWCPRGQHWQPLSEFYVCPSVPVVGSHSAYCKACSRAAALQNQRVRRGTMAPADTAAASDELAVSRGLPSAPRERAAAQLLADPLAPDSLIAARADCSVSTASIVRREMAAAGEIPARPAHGGGASRLPVPELPRAPDWSEGLCTTLPSQSRAWWTSELPAEQQLAAEMCLDCPIMTACSAWAVRAGQEWTSGVVYGGLTSAELGRAHRRLLDEIAQAVRG